MKSQFNLKEQVYNYITSRIVSGELGANSQIDEQKICADLNVSKTPVREALMQLATEGVLTKAPRKGFSVKGLSDEQVFDLYVLIGALDGLAAELACDNLDEDVLQEMEFYVLSMELAIDMNNSAMYYKQQLNFHQLYIDRCENSILIEKLSELKKKLLKKNYRIEDIEKKKEVLRNTNSQHKEMVEMFRKKDKAKLREYVEKVHWDPTKGYWESF